MKKIIAALVILVIPMSAFGQSIQGPMQTPKPNFYIRVQNLNGTFDYFPSSIKPETLEQIDTKDGVPVYGYIPPQIINQPIKTQESPQPPPLTKKLISKKGGDIATAVLPLKINSINNQKALDEFNAIITSAVPNIIGVFPASRGHIITLFGLRKATAQYIPVHIRGSTGGFTPPNADYYSIFANVAPNPSVSTPPGDTGGLGSQPGAPQPPDFSIGIPPIPVLHWGNPPPQVIFPMQTATGYALIFNFNPYEVIEAPSGGQLKVRYQLGVRGSEMVINFSDLDKDGVFTPHFYTLDLTKPNAVGITFDNEEEFYAYGVRNGYWSPIKTFFGNPTHTVNTMGDWRYPGLHYYAMVKKYTPIKNINGNIISFNLKDTTGGPLGTTGPIGTNTIKDTIKKNPNARFWIYYNEKTREYVLKVID
jgi:hypothetical protein